MREVPAEIPVSKPVLDPISATEVFALLHVPPPTPVNVEVAFTQTDKDPVGVEGLGLMVKTAVVVATPQPLVMV
jgi:hypothetical protein